MTLKAFIDFVQKQLAPLYPVEECRAMAVRLLKEVVQGYKGYEHYVEPHRELETFQLEEVFVGSMQLAATNQSPDGSNASCDHLSLEKFLLSAAGRLSSGEPIQYVLGYEWFCGHKFNVAPGVLIPRPETEEIVYKAINLITEIAQHTTEKPLRILDICTGSGCIAWSMAAAFPQAEVYACDISQQALKIATTQQIQCADGTPAKVKFLECDILNSQALQKIAQECGEAGFNMIISNPPYVCNSEKSQMRENVLNHEPHLALFVPDSNPLMFYRAIAQLSGRILTPGGILLFEINERFGAETVQMMQQMGYTNCQILQDIFGKDRGVTGLA